MSKRWLVLLVGALLAAAACGNDDGDDSNAAPGGGGQEDPAPGEGCDDSDPIVIGVANTVSGPSAQIGVSTQQGFDLARDHLNEAGGVLGRCLTFITKDDGGEPTKAAQVMRELVDEDEVDAVLGPFLSSAMGATLDITTQAGIVQIVLGTLPEAGDATLYPYVFRPENPSTGQAPAIAAFVDRAGFESAAVLGVNNGLGQALVPAVAAELEELGVDVQATELHEGGLVDFGPQLRNVLAGDPEVLVLANIGTDAVNTLRSLQLVAPDLPVVGLGVIADRPTIEAVGFDNMENVYAGPTYRPLTRLPGSDDPSTDEATAFRDAFAELIGQDPLTVNIQQPAAAYDDVMMLAAAIEAAGEIDADAIRAHLEENGHEGVRGTYRFTEENHDGVDWRETVFVLARSLDDGTLELAPGEV
ncbi:MAG: ABC transporter substrate-binding protein [Acidimicrobiia bacterium]